MSETNGRGGDYRRLLQTSLAFAQAHVVSRPQDRGGVLFVGPPASDAQREAPKAICQVNRLLEQRHASRAALVEQLIGDEDEATSVVCGREPEAAVEAFASTVPTTIDGLLAMVAYAAELNEQNSSNFDGSVPIFESMAAAAKSLLHQRAS